MEYYNDMKSKNPYNPSEESKPDPFKMLGNGPKVRGEPARSTEDWMQELREGEEESNQTQAPPASE